MRLWCCCFLLAFLTLAKAQTKVCPFDSTTDSTWQQTNALTYGDGQCASTYFPSPNGPLSRYCYSNGTWGPVINPCVGFDPCNKTLICENGGTCYSGVCYCPLQYSGYFCETLLYCYNETFDNAHWNNTVPGNQTTGVCQGNFVGSPIRYCIKENGTAIWGPVEFQCVLYCDTTTFDNATWPTTVQGATANGTCLSGYVGSPQRICLSNSTTGYWGNVTSPCVKSNITSTSQIIATQTSTPQSTNVPSQTGNSSSNSSLYVGIGVGVGVGALILIAVIFFAFFQLKYKKMKRNKETKSRIFSSEIAGIPLDPRAPSSAYSQDVLLSTTLINTQREITLPLFLLLKYPKDFRTDEVLGKGGSGTIFKGELLDTSLKEKHKLDFVAVKFINDNTNISSEDNDKLFNSEVAVMWSLSFQPNIIQLIGFCQEPKAIITPIYDTDLNDLVLVNKVQISEIQILYLVAGIIKGMIAVHQLRIAHRDLKPSNVFIKFEREKEEMLFRPIIADFGIAVFTEEYTVEKKDLNFVQGFSVRYAAPEVFSRMYAPQAGPLDIELEKKSDIYSFSIILFEMITSEYAWKTLTKEEVEYNVRMGKRPELPEKINALSARTWQVLRSIIEACWVETPDKRPSFEQTLSTFETLK